jgi:uncharacterized membrane protein YhaH (DUF805 family)
MEWYLTSFHRYREFGRGRARRTEFWTYSIVNLLVSGLLGWLGLVLLFDFNTILTSTADPSDLSLGATVRVVVYAFAVLMLFVVWVLTMVPTVGVAVRRLHDIGFSGWMLLIALVPIVGPIALFVMWCLNGQTVENRFGFNPKLHPATAERRHVAAMGDAR